MTAPAELRRRIGDVLQWDPAADRTRVDISLDNGGFVALQGVVHTYADKCSIEEVVRRAGGVSDVSNLLEVRLTIGDYRSDATLERVLRELLESLARMPAQRPRVSVKDGWVTLEGSVPCAFQKQLVESAVREVAGVRGITNGIEIR